MKASKYYHSVLLNPHVNLSLCFPVCQNIHISVQKQRFVPSVDPTLLICDVHRRP